MIHLTVDGKEIEVPEGTLILDATKEVGADVPTFCYHHLMDPVAACRMCLVEVEKRPKLEPACAVTVTEGMVVHTESERVLTARKGVLEFLLLQHPLDCPVCDKGGECDLQDHTINHAAFRSRYEQPKIHKAKAKILSDLVVLDEERCIVCQRCVRFMDEVVEEPQLALKERGARTVVSTFPDRPFDSVFSGNTIEMCPVGALTSRPYRFRARPWDNMSASSVCTHCAVGCNVTAQARDGEMVRILSRENLNVDGGWLCDRGRFGYRWVHSNRRYTHPVLHEGDDRTERPLGWQSAVATVRKALDSSPARVGILGGGHLTAEAQVAVSHLAKELGTTYVDHRTGALRYPTPPGPRAAIADLDRADRILLVGVNPLEDVPVLDLRIKKAMHRGSRVLVLGDRRVLSHYEPVTALTTPRQVGRTLDALTRIVESGKGANAVDTGAGVDRGDAVAELGQALLSGEHTVILWSGEDGAEELGRLAGALGPRLIGTLVTGGNPTSQGAEHTGLRSEHSSREILTAAANGELDVLICLDDDLFEVTPDPELATRAFDRTPFTVTLAALPTEAAVRADLVLPLAANFEQDGHYVNLEGRVQPNGALLPPPGEARADYMILAELARIEEDPASLLGRYQALPAPAFRESGDEEAMANALSALGQPGPDMLVASSSTIRFDASVRWEDALRPRTPSPYAALHPDTMQSLGLEPGGRAQLVSPLLREPVQVEVRVDESLPHAVVLLPRRVIGLPSLHLGGTPVRLEPLSELTAQVGAHEAAGAGALRQKEA